MSQPRPNWAAFGEMVGDLKRSLDNVGDTQKKLMRVTGTAWSCPDGGGCWKPAGMNGSPG